MPLEQAKLLRDNERSSIRQREKTNPQWTGMRAGGGRMP
jgi:hypothetical protein